MKATYPIPFLIPKPKNRRELELLGGAAYDYLEELFEAASKCDSRAITKLHAFAASAVSTLQRLEDCQPEALRKVKECELGWPVFWSPVNSFQAMQSHYVEGVASKAGMKTSGKQCDADNVATVAAWNVLMRLRWRLGPKTAKLTRANFPRWRGEAEKAFVDEFGQRYERHRIFKHYLELGDSLSVKEQKKARGLVRREIKKRVMQAIRGLIGVS